MPELADEAFAAVGDSLRRRVELILLRPAYRARCADGSTRRIAARWSRTGGAWRSPPTASCGRSARGCVLGFRPGDPRHRVG